MKLLIVVLLLPFAASHGQVDRPVSPEDLADQLTAERNEIKNRLNVLSAVREHLRALTSAADGADPKALAPVVHADLLICLAKGDFYRKESELYERAAVSAGEVARAWEQKGTAGANTPSEDAFAGQLGEIDRRTRELAAKTQLSDEDRGELLALQSRRKPLQDALALLARVRANSIDPAKYAAAAKQMRSKEHLFQLRAEDSRAGVLEENIQCESSVLTLRDLSDRLRLRDELRRWMAMPLAGSSKAPAFKLD